MESLAEENLQNQAIISEVETGIKPGIHRCGRIAGVALSMAFHKHFKNITVWKSYI